MRIMHEHCMEHNVDTFKELLNRTVNAKNFEHNYTSARLLDANITISIMHVCNIAIV